MLASLLDTDRLSVQAILAVAKSLLEAQALGLYRVSPAGPDYILQGAMPEAFPESLPASALDPLHRPGVWSLGQRPDHALHRAARQAALGVLRTEPLGTDVAWIGVLVAGWHEAADPPADAQDLMAIIALVCHAAILLGLQSAGVADLQRSILQLEGEIRGQFAAVNEGVLSLDESLHVVRANPASARLLGYEQKEIEGVAVQDVLVGPDDLVALLLDALGHERKVDQKRLTFHRRDGTPFPAQLRAVPLSREGRPRLLLVISDHTERQAIEDQTEVLTQRALLGEVSAIFAHEVRNPINNISTGVQLVASRLGDQHPLHESLDRVRKECVRLDQLMQDVLFFARPLELKMEPLDLIDVMKRLLARWQPRLNQANVRTHTTLEAGTPRVLADPRTLEQVLVNLIANAVQAMADGGTLSVAAGRAAAPNVGMIELKVADTGPGIPQDLVDRVFDPFFTTKKEGTGLGLAISRRIVNAHKGHIRVESYPGAGTVFTIQLPAAPPPAEVAT
jgi:PAS domain S-box-containing protein